MYGLRLLKLIYDRFCSPVYSSMYWGRGWMEAYCNLGQSPCGYEIHKCGFHSVFSFETLDDEHFWMDLSSKYPLVATLCEFSGKIIVGENGLRAERARVIGIVDRYAVSELINNACLYFNVPVYTEDEAAKAIHARNQGS